MTFHPYQRRIANELAALLPAYSGVISSVTSEDPTRWEVTLVNGVCVTVDFVHNFPFRSPSINFTNFIDNHHLSKCRVEYGWEVAAAVGSMLVNAYAETEVVLVPKRRMGLLRCAPMLMLWRKRATERLYHPSRIDFVTELKELNALLF